jgi:hypothetical protein
MMIELLIAITLQGNVDQYDGFRGDVEQESIPGVVLKTDPIFNGCLQIPAKAAEISPPYAVQGCIKEFAKPYEFIIVPGIPQLGLTDHSIKELFINQKTPIELPINQGKTPEELKYLFLKEQYSQDCFWTNTLEYVLMVKHEFWKTRWKRIQRWDYAPQMGYGIAWKKKAEIKEVIMKAKEYGIELE